MEYSFSNMLMLRILLLFTNIFIDNVKDRCASNL